MILDFITDSDIEFRASLMKFLSMKGITTWVNKSSYLPNYHDLNVYYGLVLVVYPSIKEISSMLLTF
jgi:hypothetical protein